MFYQKKSCFYSEIRFRNTDLQRNYYIQLKKEELGNLLY
jgi:hypothetical protein